MSGETTPRKLQKKRVHFTPSTTGESDTLITPLTPIEGDLERESIPYSSYFPEYEPVLPPLVKYAPPTPDPTPPRDEKKIKKKTSWLHNLRLTSANTKPLQPSTPTPNSMTNSDHDWHHHSSYYPEYEPIFPLTYSQNTLPRFQAHQQSDFGHSVAIHYPVLPLWRDYNGGSVGDKTKTGWTSGKSGVAGWTGYGWDGEKLPNADGLSFGAPMPKGVPLDGDEGKKKKGGGGDGGGDGGEKKEKEGEEGEEKESPAKGGDPVEGADAAGGAGGGNKKNKKK
ncbi:MAG: hypothetical protein TREMPRED_001768 [Tremellales sp. Tagirdzhanova-0007]|nr:MAG: hypothetical protein TREMPRED_001768 [Tremellales sp. Tagirdzhanova-0007]